MLTTLNGSEDQRLWELIRSGDENAFAIFFHKHWHGLFSLAYRLLKSYDDAQDIVQTVYISIWERRDTLTFNYSFENYLLQAVRFQSLKKLNAILDDPQSLDRIQQDFLPVFNEIWDRLREKELFREIEDHLSSLPSRTKEIFLLSRQYQLTIPEIAERLGISEKTVRNQLHLALKVLRPSIALALLFSVLG
jgi:RNA polymerase sigma-70 factor (ECF subfamily)